MAQPEEEAQRTALEGRAELLEATRWRYRALCRALQGPFWRGKVRRCADVLCAAVADAPAAHAALGLAQRRAQAEAWPRSSRWVRCFDELEQLGADLRRSVLRRLGPSPEVARGDADESPERGQPRPELAGLLARLEQEVVLAPRKVRPGERWSTAMQVLPASVPEVAAVARWGERLEAVATRPFDPGVGWPWPRDEALALERDWPELERTLAQAWARVGRVDTTGALGRYLRRRAERRPSRRPRSGPEQLLRAEHWRGQLPIVLGAAVRRGIEPLEPDPGELWALFAWMSAREHREEAPELGERLAPARAAAFELAYGLTRALRSRVPPAPQVWRHLAERARQAEGAGEALIGPLKETLRVFVRARGLQVGGADSLERRLARASVRRLPDDASLADCVEAAQRALG